MYAVVIRHIEPGKRQRSINIASRLHQSALMSLYTLGFLLVMVWGAQADDFPATNDLVNTIWVSNEYSYVGVSPDGTVESFQGAEFYIEFVQIKGSVLVAKTQWISPEEKLSGFQHLLFAPQGSGNFSFQAAGAPNVVGGSVNGSMRFVSDTEAAFTSFNLENNRAGAIVSTINKVDALPEKFVSDK